MANKLQEALVEAKELRDAALEAAKLAIEESFRPHLESMISNKLKYESEQSVAEAEETKEDGEAVDEQTTLNSSGIGTGDNKMPAPAARSSSDIENPGQETDTLGEDAEAEVDDVDLDGDGDADADIDVDVDVDADDSSDAEGMEDDEFDLEAVIRELEADFGGDTESGDEEMAPTDESVDRFAKPEGGKQVTEAAPVEEAEEEDDEMSENVSESTEPNLEEILREMNAEEAKETATLESLRSENVQLKRELAEHRKGMEKMLGWLKEAKLINKKLYYTGKLFNNLELTQEQKKIVNESFNRSTTERELNIAYTALVEAFSNSTGKKKSGRLVEGRASKPVANTRPKSPEATKVLEEGIDSDLKAMFQRRASIKK